MTWDTKRLDRDNLQIKIYFLKNLLAFSLFEIDFYFAITLSKLLVSHVTVSEAFTVFLGLFT